MSDCGQPGCYLGWHWLQRGGDDAEPLERCPVSLGLESATNTTETRPKATFGGDWFVNSLGQRVSIEKDRERSKWWVVIDGRRLSDHVNRSAAATAANNHR